MALSINTVENIILDKNFEIEQIIHISDIHIKSSKKKEYEEIFLNLYGFLKKNTTSKKFY